VIGRSPAAEVRRARSRARRERQSLGDALYVLYVSALVSAYPLVILGERAAPTASPVRSAFAAVEPLVLVALGLSLLVGRAAAAVRGGPVVLPPEDARMMLTWPVSRRSLVLPALGAALVRALAAAGLVTAVLLYVDVRDLGATAASVARDDLLLPALLAVLVVLVAWLVQVSPRLAGVVRGLGALLALAALVGLCWMARKVALDGFTGALVDLADLGPAQADLPLSGAAVGQASRNGLLVLSVLGALVLPLSLLAYRAAGRATPEHLLSRSRRADVTRTGLKLGFTSSVYLTRTEPVRRSRRSRRALPHRPGALWALLAKAFVQEQGTPVVPRVLACAAVVGSVLAAAARITPGRSLAATCVWAAVSAVALTVVATRFADPLRLDVDRAPLAGAVPVRHLLVARADLAVSALLAFVGALLGAVGAVALGVVPAGRLPALVLAGVSLALLLAAAGALGALSDDPSPFLPPALALGYRTSGFLAVTAGCLLAAVSLRYQSATPDPVVHDRLPTAAFALAAVAVIAATVAAFRAAGALTRGR
jgi:hypothetical protein